MSTVGWATLDVIPSVKGLRAELEKQTGGDLSRAGAIGGKKYGDAAGKEAAGRFKGHLATATDDLKQMLTSPLAVGAIGTGIVLGFKSIKTSASEAEQAVGGVQAVFKEYADGVLADSRRADQALGLSATAYQELITLSAALLKNKGIEDFAEQGKTLIEVGADLAAQFGGSTREAVEALNAATRGESDPIERYAISLNEAAINAELARTGMSGLEGAALDQAKTQARLSLIMQQSADAQGAFGREADTAAGKEARLSAELANMRQELGEKVLPTYASFVGFLNDEGIPALTTVGGVAQDVGSAISELPAPVKAAAAAFVALRLASATGLTDAVAGGVARTGSAIDDLRLRTMLAADEYRRARTVTREFAGTTAQVSSGVGRMSASLSAGRVSAQGFGGALKGSLSSGMAMLGGPWGAAMIGATALVTAFWQEHERAKAQVDAFAGSLDAASGSITQDTYRQAAESLKGWSAAAEDAGISGEELVRAVIEGGDALDDVARRFEEYQSRGFGSSLWDSVTHDSADFEGRLSTLHEELGRGQSQWEFTQDAISGYEGAVEGSAAATDEASGSLRTYGARLDDARSKLQKLIDKEKERALNAVQTRRDHIALIETLHAAREEANDGKRTLEENTAAGRANMSALLDLAEQWGNSTPKVQNAKGAYEEMRRKFIEIATAMGGGSDSAAAQAKKLADQLLKVPKNADVKFRSEGYRERLAEIASLKAALSTINPASVYYAPRGQGGAGPSRAPGPDTNGNGALAQQGPSQTAAPRANVLIENQTVVAQDPGVFKREMQRQHQMAGIGGIG